MSILSRVLPLAAVLLMVTGLLSGCAGFSEPRSAVEPCPLWAMPEPPEFPVDPCPSDRLSVAQALELELLMKEVAVLAHEGEQALRDALAVPDSRPLRQALLLLALDDRSQEPRALELLEAHLVEEDLPHGETLLASLLRDQIRARQSLHTNLTEIRTERDALQRQLEELKAIEEQIRDRARTPDVELQK